MDKDTDDFDEMEDKYEYLGTEEAEDGDGELKNYMRSTIQFNQINNNSKGLSSLMIQ